MTEEDREFIEAVRRSREEEARFFANQPEMERWVVGQFLTRLKVVFRADELISRPQYDNVDIAFRDARFQVKEVYDKDFELRDHETREMLKLAKDAVTPGDLFPPVIGRDIVALDLMEPIRAVATSFKFPPRERAALDLLFYVTRPYCGFRNPPGIVGEELSGLGWRSISCLLGQRPYVLTLAHDAPDFLCHR